MRILKSRKLHSLHAAESPWQCIAILKLVLCNFVLKKKAVIFYCSDHRQSVLSIHVKHSLDQWCTTALEPNPAHDEASCGPPCPAGKVVLLELALTFNSLQRNTTLIENIWIILPEQARRKPSWILSRQPCLSIQDETEVVPMASRLSILIHLHTFQS